MGAGVAAAVTFVWLGIGRLVFRALNLLEAGLLVVAVVAAAVGAASTTAWVLVAVAAVVLAVQLLAVRPALNRRTDAVLAAADPTEVPRSRAHFAYVGLEVAKVVVLIALGAAFLAS